MRPKKLWIVFLAGVLLAFSFSPARAAMKGIVLVEAEAFADHGGWSLDQQFMDLMGSPYLLAHGLGEPVADAATTARIEEGGKYHLYVRTNDWVGQWKTGDPAKDAGQIKNAAAGGKELLPGRFQVLVNGKPVPAEFGTEGAEWHWQDGGTVDLPSGELKLALHDLTGFEGRCDAILFVSAEGFVPPNELKALELFRRQALGLPDTPRDAGNYDLVVVGGGIPGICAALTAARLGLNVALVQDRPVLGGNNSSEVRVWLNGNVGFAPYPHIGDVVKELEPAKRAHAGPTNTAEIYEDPKREALVRDEKNIKLFLECRVNGVEMAEKKIKAVLAQNTRTGERIRLAGRLFSDCTGDGCVGMMAGADYEITPTQHMGPTNVWNVVDTGKPAPFPRCPWAIDLSDKPFPGRTKLTAAAAPKTEAKKAATKKTAKTSEKKAAAKPAEKKTAAKPAAPPKPAANPLDSLGQWFWETGFDWDPIKDVEKMRDYNLRAMYGAWDALKNVDKMYPNHKINWAAYVTGKRESVRLMGDVVLGDKDFIDSKKYEDACYPCTWTIDLHYPEARYVKGFEGNAFLSYATHGKYQIPYWAPYRTLYSRNIGNLFMAGRDISVTHLGMGPTRVMRTGGVMGEIVGMAASLCIKTESSPRGVYQDHMDDLRKLMEKGAGKQK